MKNEQKLDVQSSLWICGLFTAYTYDQILNANCNGFYYMNLNWPVKKMRSRLLKVYILLKTISGEVKTPQALGDMQFSQQFETV